MEHPKESDPEPLVIKIDSSKATIEKRSLAAVTYATSRTTPRAG